MKERCELIRVSFRVVAPISLIPGGPELLVEVPRGSKVGAAALELYRKYGSSLRTTLFEADGKPFVTFLVRGQAVSPDYTMENDDNVTVLPPIYGG